MRTVPLRLVTAALLVLGASTVLGSEPASADASPEIVLPLTHLGDIAVDSAHGHVFFSGGDGLVMTDLDGGSPTVLPVAAGAQGLALSPDGTRLYAALPADDAIAVVATDSTAETARIDTGTGTHPATLEFAGDTLWFGYGSSGAGGIGSLASDGTVKLAQDGASWPSVPELASTPGPSDILAAAAQHGSTTTAAVFTAADGVLTRTASRELQVPDLNGIEVSADGADLLVPNPLHDPEYRISDLSTAGDLAAELNGSAAAVAPDGSVAGFDNFDYTFYASPAHMSPGYGGWYNEYAFSGSELLVAHGLAWDPDESRLYGVARDPGTGCLFLRVAHDPTTTVVSLRGDTVTATPGWQFRDTIHLVSGLLQPAPGDHQVTRFDAAHPDGLVLPAGTWTRQPSVWDLYPSYTFKDDTPAPLTGPLNYRIDYSGGPHYAPVSTTLTIPVVKASVALKLSAPATAPVALPLTVTGVLNAAVTGSVSVTRVDPAHPQGVSLGTAALDQGRFTFHDIPTVEGSDRYRFDWAGTPSLQAASATATVAVSRQVPAIRLSVPATAARAQPLTLSGWVGLALVRPGDAVRVVKTDLAHPKGYLLATAALDAKGHFTVHDTPQIGGGNRYVFQFTGDVSYRPVTATRTVQVSRYATPLSVRTSPGTLYPGSTATVTAHLGTTWNGHTVSLYAQPVNGTRKLLATGRVDTHGNLTARYRVARNTVFSAVYAGDYRYAARTVARTAVVTPKLHSMLENSLGKTRIGTKVYQVVYKSEQTVGLNLQATPAQETGCFFFTLQHFSGGSWHTISSTSCTRVPADGDGAWGWKIKNLADHGRYRVTGRYVPPAQGAWSTAATAPWTYFTVRPGSP